MVHAELLVRVTRQGVVSATEGSLNHDLAKIAQVERRHPSISCPRPASRDLLRDDGTGPYSARTELQSESLVFTVGPPQHMVCMAHAPLGGLVYSLL